MFILGFIMLFVLAQIGPDIESGNLFYWIILITTLPLIILFHGGEPNYVNSVSGFLETTVYFFFVGVLITAFISWSGRKIRSLFFR